MSSKTAPDTPLGRRARSLAEAQVRDLAERGQRSPVHIEDAAYSIWEDLTSSIRGAAEDVRALHDRLDAEAWVEGEQFVLKTSSAEEARLVAAALTLAAARAERAFASAEWGDPPGQDHLRESYMTEYEDAVAEAARAFEEASRAFDQA